jgi:hypothetical protein
MKLLFAALVVLFAVLSGCLYKGKIFTTIGRIHYEFPNHRVDHISYKGDGRGDSYGPTLLSWNREEVSNAIPKFVHDAEGVTYGFHVQVYPDFDGDSAPKLDSYLLRGDFAGGLVEFDPDTKLYRVRRRTDRERWDLLSVPPNPSDVAVQTVNRLWIADCTKPFGFTHVLCRMEMQYRDSNLSVKVLAENLFLRDEIATFIRRELDSAYRKARESN